MIVKYRLYVVFKDIYSAHPSFVATFKTLPYPEAAAQELDCIYRCLSSDSRAVSSNSLARLQKHSQDILNSIFDIWKRFPVSQLQIDFLQDLQQEALLLIREDFTKFKLQSQSDVRHSLSPSEFNKLIQLSSKGYLFDNFADSNAHSLRIVADSLVTQFINNESNDYCTREDLSANDGNVIKRLVNMLDRIFEQSSVNKLMSSYLGYDVHIGALALEMGSVKSTWWQTSYDEKPKTLYIHRDESISVPKAFVYLNHISKQQGAISVFPNSNSIHGEPTYLQNLVGRRIGWIGRSQEHNTYGQFKHTYHKAFGDSTYRSLFLSLPPQARYSSHYGWDLMHCDPIHTQLLEDELILEGPPGTFLLFDGARVSHRALHNATNAHISLQAIFTPRTPFLAKLYSKLSFTRQHYPQT